MTTQVYQQLIIEGIKDLPPEILAEITDFVFFLRKKALHPRAFEAELQDTLLEAELKQLSRDQEIHLEQEFEDYDRQYPHQ